MNSFDLGMVCRESLAHIKDGDLSLQLPFLEGNRGITVRIPEVMLNGHG